MKCLFTFLGLLFSLSAEAGVLYSGEIVPSTTNLTTTYTLAGGANVSMPNALKFGGQFCVYNANSANIAVYVDNDLAAAAPSVNVQDIYVPAGASYCLPIITRVSRSVQFRSDSGSTISSGGSIFYILTDHKG